MKKKFSKGDAIFCTIVVIVLIILIWNNTGKGKASNLCDFEGCTNPVYSYTNNINGYCEKHRKEYENWEYMQNLKKAIESNK